MIKKFIDWWIGGCEVIDLDAEIDKAYCAGAKKEREEILSILDRLIPQFVQVNNSVARQARAEIFERGNCENKN